ncbi:MAG: hypothetical protein U9N09_07750 [Euryarchaeota archaeon]|nr:hypothetical protein [Euryarchaeota archaeon]
MVDDDGGAGYASMQARMWWRDPIARDAGCRSEYADAADVSHDDKVYIIGRG